MTVEEIEIIVTAKVEEALKEFQKILPAIKQSMKQAQEAFSKVDTKKMTNKLQQAVQFMKKKMQDFKKSTENNEIAIKVNNKDAEKQISQIQKQIESLQEKINARKMKLNVITPKLDEITAKTTKEVTPDGVSSDNPAIQQTINNSLTKNKEYNTLIAQEQKMTQEIATYSEQLNQAKVKMSQLKQEVNQTRTSQSKLTSFFSVFKNKINQAKVSIGSVKKAIEQMPKITQNITNNIKGIGKGLKQGLGHVLKYAAALFSLRGIYSVLSSSANSWLSSQNAGAKQLSANIDYMKYAMGSALAPVIQFVTNLVYQLMKAIQSVVYALTGINIFAKASASSYASMASNAKKAKNETKQLAGIHDEINNIQDSDSSDNGGGTASPSLDLSEIDNQMSPLAQKLYDFFKPLKDSWDTYGQQVISSFKNACSGVGAAISAMWNSVETIFTNGTIYSIIANILNSIGAIGQAWANAWNNDNNGTEIIQTVANMINNLTATILNLVSSTGFQQFLTGVLSAFSGILQFIQPIVDGFTSMSGVILEIVLSGIGTLFEWIGNTLQAIAQNQTAVEILTAVGEAIAIVVGVILLFKATMIAINAVMTAFSIITSPISLIILGIVAAITAIILIIKNWGTISEWFGNLWQAVSDKIQEIWNSIKEFFIEVWNAIVDFIVGIITKWVEFQQAKFEFLKNIVVTVCTAIKDFFVNTWNNIVNTISNVWNTIVTKVKQGVSGAWNAITSVFGNIGNWFKDKFSQAWQAVKNVFSTGGAIFDGIKDGILNGLKSIVNAIINGINKVISIPFNGLNSALRAIKSVNIMGLTPFSWISTISVPQIPRLAKGSVLYDETLVMAGEYSGAKSNPEIVTPQNIMEETFDRVMSRHQGNNGSQQHLSIYYMGKEIFDDTIDYINEKTRRTGKCVIKVT